MRSIFPMMRLPRRPGPRWHGSCLDMEVLLPLHMLVPGRNMACCGKSNTVSGGGRIR